MCLSRTFAKLQNDHQYLWLVVGSGGVWWCTKALITQSLTERYQLPYCPDTRTVLSGMPSNQIILCTTPLHILA